MRLGAGLGVGQAWAQAGVQGAGRRHAWLACGRAHRACWRWAWVQALGRAGERHDMGARSAGGRAGGRRAGACGAQAGRRQRAR